MDAGEQRAAMVRRLRDGGVTDERVLAAMAEVPRERFVPARLAGEAYESRPLPIGSGQTISAPDVVAVMAAALELQGTERVLEVGGGRGYAAAVLSHLAREVVTVEYHPPLADAARDALADRPNVEVRTGDGSVGVPDRAPFDGVVVAAMAPNAVPDALLEQLAPDGVVVCPVGGEHHGDLVRIGPDRTETLMAVSFVPLL